jgi:glycosyltransferase involved in cell wall biosynthesis
MKTIVFLHTDLRIYWPVRLKVFREHISNFGYDVKVIEIAGDGGNYAFDQTNRPDDYWECLFPEYSMTELKPVEIQKVLIQRLKALNPSALIAGALAFSSGALAIKYTVQQNIPLILFDDAKLEDVQRNRFINWIKKQLYSGVDAVFCPSSEWDATFRFFGFDKNRLFYGVNVVDNNFFKRQHQNEEKNEYQIPNGYFLNIGRQIEKKNLLLILKAYEILQNKVVDCPHLLFVGDGESRSTMENFVTTQHLKNVHFIPFQSQEKLVKLYHHASLFILPSLYAETWGLVINEAMAASLPVAVSNKVGCASTLVEEHVNGFTFDPTDPTELSEKLTAFINLDQEIKDRMGRSAEKEIEKWDINRFAKGLIEAITFVETNPKRKITLTGKLLSKFWMGRYRPL